MKNDENEWKISPSFYSSKTKFTSLSSAGRTQQEAKQSHTHKVALHGGLRSTIMLYIDLCVPLLLVPIKSLYI